MCCMMKAAHTVVLLVVLLHVQHMPQCKASVSEKALNAHSVLSLCQNEY